MRNRLDEEYRKRNNNPVHKSFPIGDIKVGLKLGCESNLRSE